MVIVQQPIASELSSVMLEMIRPFPKAAARKINYSRLDMMTTRLKSRFDKNDQDVLCALGDVVLNFLFIYLKQSRCQGSESENAKVIVFQFEFE